MIKNCNNVNLANDGVDSKYYLLFQVWKELTEAKTLDSYQYRIMNTLSALRELSEVIGHRLNRYHNSNHNIDECKKETQIIIKNDKVLKKHYPVIWKRLLAHLSERTDTDSQQRALRYQIEYCFNILQESYLNVLVEELEHDITINDRKGIVEKANQLISNCASRGWSTLALHNLIDILCDSSSEPSKWDLFKGRVLTLSEEIYRIYIPLKVKTIQNGSQSKTAAKEKIRKEIKDLGIVIKDSEIVQQEIEGCEGEKKVEKNNDYMVIDVEAYDYYAASYKAIGKCSDVLNLLSFYNFIEAWSIRELSWLAINNTNKNIRVIRTKDIYGVYDFIESANRIYKASKRLDLLEGKIIQNKLRATYSYFNMGKASVAQEEKFINTWVALESLCRSDVYDNIISNILETVPPALCLRYIYRHYRNFIEDCGRCGVSLEFSTKEISALVASKETLVREIIEVFSDDILYQELYTKCQINDLLAERCKDLRELIIDSSKMFQKIEQHNLNVRMQLSRLYRLRNEIAHTAMGAERPLVLYIEHLDDYLSSFVAEVVMYAERKNEESIEVIFEIIKDNYREFIDIKSCRKGANAISLLDNLKKTGIISLV